MMGMVQSKVSKRESVIAKKKERKHGGNKCINDLKRRTSAAEVIAKKKEGMEVTMYKRTSNASSITTIFSTESKRIVESPSNGSNHLWVVDRFEAPIAVRPVLYDERGGNGSYRRRCWVGSDVVVVGGGSSNCIELRAVVVVGEIAVGNNDDFVVGNGNAAIVIHIGAECIGSLCGWGASNALVFVVLNALVGSIRLRVVLQVNAGTIVARVCRIVSGSKNDAGIQGGRSRRNGRVEMRRNLTCSGIAEILIIIVRIRADDYRASASNDWGRKEATITSADNRAAGDGDGPG
jgi:hypothetical protein